MWHSKLDAYNRRTLGFMMQAGLTLIFGKFDSITKESWGVGKIVWSDQIFFVFCIKHWVQNSRQECCFLVNLLTRLLTSILTCKMISSSEGETRYATTFSRPWLSAIFVFFWSWTGGQFSTQLCHKQANNNKVSLWWGGKSLLIIML